MFIQSYFLTQLSPFYEAIFYTMKIGLVFLGGIT